MFSPYYRRAGRRAPLDHCAINVGLYGRGTRWAMTERGAGAVRQGPAAFEVGPSALRWEGGALTAEIDELAVPHMLRIRGRVRVMPAAVTGLEVDLGCGHVWRPFAPVADIEVDLDLPGWRWRGSGYLDGNFGASALEADFRTWTWGRFPTSRGCAVFYDAERRDGSEVAVALGFGPDGGAEPVEAPPMTPLRPSFWRLARGTRADPGAAPRQVKAMLDVPFYTRSLVATRLWGEASTGVHEALDLDRFAHPLNQMLLPLRMPRRA